jgi:hypothetical protein
VFTFGPWRFIYEGFHPASAYTPKLAELNEAHLRKDRAVDHIFFDVSTVDGRFACQDDSFSGRNC